MKNKRKSDTHYLYMPEPVQLIDKNIKLDRYMVEPHYDGMRGSIETSTGNVYDVDGNFLIRIHAFKHELWPDMDVQIMADKKSDIPGFLKGKKDGYFVITDAIRAFQKALDRYTDIAKLQYEIISVYKNIHVVPCVFAENWTDVNNYVKNFKSNDLCDGVILKLKNSVYPMSTKTPMQFRDWIRITENV